MKEQITVMYQNGEITANGVMQAVTRGWITVDDAVEIFGEDNSVETVKSAKLMEISKICNDVIISGFDIDLGDGDLIHFNLSIEDQSNINNLFRVVELGGTEFPYQSDGGFCRVYSASEIVQIYVAAQTLITTQTTYHNELKQYVQSLESVEEISAVQYGMDLPEPYLTEMNGKLAVAQQQMQTIVARMAQYASEV